LVDGVPNPAQLSPNVLWSALAFGFLATGVAYLIYYWLQATLHATQASLVTYLPPVAAVFWGWGILDESIGLAVWPGLALILLGMYLVNRPAKSLDRRPKQVTRRRLASPPRGSRRTARRILRPV
jgi:drug/metabolite transporter (DMT)-like permease